MSPAEMDRMTADVAAALVRRTPLTIDPATAAPWAMDLLNLCAGNSVAGKDDWPAAMEFFGLGVLCTIAHPPEAGADPPAGLPPASPSAPLMDYLVELYSANPPDAPMPINSFMVGVRGEDVWVAQPLRPRLSKGEAVNLAVWLLALADPNLKAFGPMFAKVGGF